MDDGQKLLHRRPGSGAKADSLRLLRGNEGDRGCHAVAFICVCPDYVDEIGIYSGQTRNIRCMTFEPFLLSFLSNQDGAGLSPRSSAVLLTRDHEISTRPAGVSTTGGLFLLTEFFERVVS